MPFEKRWRRIARGIAPHGVAARHGSRSVRPVVFYDPYEQDRRHVELIERAYPRTQAAPLPHAGRFAGGTILKFIIRSSARPGGGC